MNRWGLLLIFMLALAMCVPFLSMYIDAGNVKPDEFYFGVSFGSPHAEEALPLIDKVKDYTNVFLIGSWDITANETALNLVCDYAADSGLKFIVYFVSKLFYSR
jgi:hypothetical protein